MASSSRIRESISQDDAENDTDLSENVVRKMEESLQIMENRWSSRFDEFVARLNIASVQDHSESGGRRGNQPASLSLSGIPSAAVSTGNVKEYRIEKLHKSNFITWSTEIEISLKEEKLWNIILDRRKFEGQIGECDFSLEEKDKEFFASCSKAVMKRGNGR